MNDLMLELINFMGRAMGRGPSNNGGRPVAVRCITAVPLALTVVFLASCATQDVVPSQQSATPSSATGALAAAQSDDGGPVAEPSPDQKIDGRGVIFRGTDVGVKMPTARQPIKLYGDAVSLNFEEAPLSEVVHSVLGDILELDYIVEHPVQGAVTLRTRSPIPRDQLLPILESLLHNNGAVMVRGPNDRLFISGAQKAGRMAPSFQNAEGAGTGFSNVIVPLQHIGAPEMAEILKPVATETAFVRIDTKRNLLVLAGTQMQIDGWLDIVTTFDIDQLAGTSVGIFPITRGEVEDVFVELEHILNTADGGTRWRRE